LAIAGLLWDTFFFFFISLLPFVAALAGVTVGTTASAVAYMASVKSVIADLLMFLSRQGYPVRRPAGGTPRRNKHSRSNRAALCFSGGNTSPGLMVRSIESDRDLASGRRCPAMSSRVVFSAAPKGEVMVVDVILSKTKVSSPK
jgi:hypothetical protein